MVTDKSELRFPVRWLRLILVAGGIALLVITWAWFAAYRDLPETVDRILRLNPSSTRSITIRPSDYSSLLETPLTITDRKTIGQFSAAMATARLSGPNHPQSKWRCHISVEDSKGRSHCTVSQTLSQGVLIYIHTGETDGWILGIYRCDNLAPLLQEWAHQD